MGSSSWRYHVLGRTELSGPGVSTWRPERKLAACLAYLALEGATPRAKLIGLLWPDVPEARARNNLSQLLRRLRLATRAELISGGELLRVAPEIAVDAVLARDLFAQGRHTDLLTFKGELLGDLQFSGSPDLDDWVLAERERFGEWRMQALRHEVTRLEEQGQFEAALVFVRELLNLDPYSEDAYRRAMRLHYLHRDRPAALKVYHKCKEMLRREFGVDPLPETQQLAGEIDCGSAIVPNLPVVKAQLPLSVLHPPNLVGRENEWTRMEEAWTRGQFIFISGEPGVGKSRFARDFLASKGEYILFEGRPGDVHVPGSTSARILRRLHTRRSELLLEPWVRREVQRFVPELIHEGEVVAPLSSDEEALRFRQALVAYSLLANEGLVAQFLDDWHFFDETSNQLGGFVFTNTFSPEQPGSMPKLIFTFRQGELSPGNQQHLDSLLQQGYATLIELRPLGGEAVEALIAQLGVPHDIGMIQSLTRLSGGNPLFLLETIKHLIEEGQLAGGLPEPLPLTEKVGQIIGRRLERLSAPALQAARAAAVLQRDFDLELVADLLNAPLLDVAQAWDELEAAQVMQGNHFAHDLVYEALRAGLSASVRQLLHRAAGRTLERHGASAARIARHWVEGGKPEAAATFLQRAAREAQNRYQLSEAAQFYSRAAELLLELGDSATAGEALAAQARVQALVDADQLTARP